VEEVGLSKAVFWKNTTGASAPVFFLHRHRVAGERVHRRARVAACDHKIYSALTRFVIAATVGSLYIAIHLC